MAGLGEGQTFTRNKGPADGPEGHAVKTVKIVEAALVYQGGIANLFTRAKGAKWIRLRQDAFGPCEDIAYGLALAGIKIRSYSCNRAGDVVDAPWSREVDEAPFREAMCPVNAN